MSYEAPQGNSIAFIFDTNEGYSAPSGSSIAFIFDPDNQHGNVSAITKISAGSGTGFGSVGVASEILGITCRSVVNISEYTAVPVLLDDENNTEFYYRWSFDPWAHTVAGDQLLQQTSTGEEPQTIYGTPSQIQVTYFHRTIPLLGDGILATLWGDTVVEDWIKWCVQLPTSDSDAVAGATVSNAFIDVMPESLLTEEFGLADVSAYRKIYPEQIPFDPAESYAGYIGSPAIKNQHLSIYLDKYGFEAEPDAVKKSTQIYNDVAYIDTKDVWAHSQYSVDNKNVTPGGFVSSQAAILNQDVEIRPDYGAFETYYPYPYHVVVNSGSSHQQTPNSAYTIYGAGATVTHWDQYAEAYPCSMSVTECGDGAVVGTDVTFYVTPSIEPPIIPITHAVIDTARRIFPDTLFLPLAADLMGDPHWVSYSPIIVSTYGETHTKIDRPVAGAVTHEIRELVVEELSQTSQFGQYVRVYDGTLKIKVISGVRSFIDPYNLDDVDGINAEPRYTIAEFGYPSARNFFLEVTRVVVPRVQDDFGVASIESQIKHITIAGAGDQTKHPKSSGTTATHENRIVFALPYHNPGASIQPDMIPLTHEVLNVLLTIPFSEQYIFDQTVMPFTELGNDHRTNNILLTTGIAPPAMTGEHGLFYGGIIIDRGIHHDNVKWVGKPIVDGDMFIDYCRVEQDYDFQCGFGQLSHLTIWAIEIDNEEAWFGDAEQAQKNHPTDSPFRPAVLHHIEQFGQVTVSSTLQYILHKEQPEAPGSHTFSRYGIPVIANTKQFIVPDASKKYDEHGYHDLFGGDLEVAVVGGRDFNTVGRDYNEHEVFQWELAQDQYITAKDGNEQTIISLTLVEKENREIELAGDIYATVWPVNAHTSTADAYYFGLPYIGVQPFIEPAGIDCAEYGRDELTLVSEDPIVITQNESTFPMTKMGYAWGSLRLGMVVRNNDIRPLPIVDAYQFVGVPFVFLGAPPPPILVTKPLVCSIG